MTSVIVVIGAGQIGQAGRAGIEIKKHHTAL
jgi:hypothetical protein